MWNAKSVFKEQNTNSYAYGYKNTTIIAMANEQEKWLKNNHFSTFSEMISSAMKESFKDGSKITRSQIADTLYYSPSYIKNLLNKNSDKYKTTNRDLIIAICACVHLTSASTDFALEKYGFPILNSADTRDAHIRDCLDQAFTINDIQALLKRMNLLELNIGSKASLASMTPAAITSPICSKDYKVVYEEILCCEFPGFNAIEMQHDPDNLSVDAEIVLENLNTQKRYRICDFGKDFSLMELDNPFKHTLFNKATKCPIPSFTEECVILRQKANSAFTKAIKLLDDTRNYGPRYDCRVVNSKLQIYVETFDYSFPETGFYFQMIKTGDKYTLTVSKRSQYLRFHIGEATYTKYYNVKNKDEIIFSFESIEDIKEKKKSQDNYKGYVQYFNEKHISNVYNELQINIKNLIKKLKTKEAIVFDTSVFDEYYRDVAKCFDIESAFEWDTSEYHSIPSSDTIDIKLLNGETKLLSFDDLRRALELGIDNLSDLAAILTEYDTIEDFII